MKGSLESDFWSGDFARGIVFQSDAIQIIEWHLQPIRYSPQGIGNAENARRGDFDILKKHSRPIPFATRIFLYTTPSMALSQPFPKLMGVYRYLSATLLAPPALSRCFLH
jgi:hypothetical protein